MKRILFLCSLVLAVAVSSSCCRNDDGGVRGVRHVILIGFDGCAGNTVTAADMPTLHKMMDEGSWTLQARSILPSSSACNWATMFMGAGPEMHGYNTWGSSTPDFPSIETNKYGIFPSIVSVLRENDPEMNICAMYEWPVIGSLIEGEATTISKNVPTDDSRGEKITEEYTTYLKENKPQFSMVIYDSPDHDGHTTGWGSDEYMKALNIVDGYLARIIEATQQAGIYDETIFIVAADHGGINMGHGSISMAEMEAPLVFFGPHVKRGFKIEQPVMRYDTAPTIAYIFGAHRPDVWRGKPISVIFE